MSWDISSPPPIFDGEDELKLKLQYARLIAGHPEKVETAGYVVFPGDHNYGRAMQARAWRSDPIVIAEMERVCSGVGAVDALPTEAEVKAYLWNMVTNSAIADKDRLKAAELLTKTMGMIKQLESSDGQLNIKIEGGLE